MDVNISKSDINQYKLIKTYFEMSHYWNMISELIEDAYDVVNDFKNMSKKSTNHWNSYSLESSANKEYMISIDYIYMNTLIKSIDENLDIHLKKNNILIINSANSENTCHNVNSLESGAKKEHIIQENSKIDNILTKCKLLSKIMNIEYPELLKKLSEFNGHDLMKNLNNFDKNIDDINVIHFKTLQV
jgi:hypothetical protein